MRNWGAVTGLTRVVRAVALVAVGAVVMSGCADEPSSARGGGEASFEVVRERIALVEGVSSADIAYRQVPVNGWGVDGTVQVAEGAEPTEVLEEVYAELSRYGEDTTTAVFVVAEQAGERFGIDGPLRDDESYAGLTAREMRERYGD